MKLTTLAISAFLAALLTTPVFASSDFDTAVKEATAEIDKAKAAGHEWRDSRKLLKKAAAAEKAGKHDEAMKLAKKAKKQGIDATAQAKAQANAGSI